MEIPKYSIGALIGDPFEGAGRYKNHHRIPNNNSHRPLSSRLIHAAQAGRSTLRAPPRRVSRHGASPMLSLVVAVNVSTPVLADVAIGTLPLWAGIPRRSTS